MPPSSTRDRLQRTALRLFEEQGYDAVSVAAIARAASVSHMTFFRHFPTKESVVAADLFDPLLASAVAEESPTLPPLHRAVRGLITALDAPGAAEELESPAFATRIRVAASTPSLRGAVWASSRTTEDAIVAALLEHAPSRGAARAAGGAVMGAATAILLEWTADAEERPADRLRNSLRSLLEDDA